MSRHANLPFHIYVKLEKLIKEEQMKTENLYVNRIATLDTMLKSVHELMETFKKGEQ